MLLYIRPAIKITRWLEERRVGVISDLLGVSQEDGIKHSGHAKF